jgi:hypothetical protein
MCSQHFGEWLLCSTLRKTIGNVRVQIPKGFSLSVWRTRGAIGRQISSNVLEEWRRLEARLSQCDLYYSPRLSHPSDLASELLPSIFPEAALRLEFGGFASFCYYIIFRQTNGGGVYARRKISITATDRYAYHDLLIADPIPPGVKIADRLLKRAVAFYRRICVRRVELVAGLSRGGAIWPKFGFRPKTEQDWRRCGQEILARLRTLDESIQLRWSDAVKHIVSIQSPRAIWLISSIAEQVEGVKLGDLLLGGTTWTGVLHLSDDEACIMLDDRLRVIP